MVQININGINRDMTAEEQAEYNQVQADFNATKEENKLKEIRALRLQKLRKTDYLANSDVTMPDNVKTWRQTLRDLPANHTDEAAYDALLARDKNGNLTHSVWSKP